MILRVCRGEEKGVNPMFAKVFNSITKERFLATIFPGVLWLVCCTALDAVASLIPTHEVKIFFAAVKWASLLCFIIRPIYIEGKRDKKGSQQTPASQQVSNFYREAEDKRERERKAAEANDRANRELETLRMIRASDINACFDGKPLTWVWLGNSADTILIRFDGQREQTAGRLQFDSAKRIYAITIDGSSVPYENTPYIIMRSMELRATDACLKNFFATRSQGSKASYYWVNRSEGKLRLTDPQSGIKDAEAIAAFNDANEIISITATLADGTSKTIAQGKALGKKNPKKTPPAEDGSADTPPTEAGDSQDPTPNDPAAPPEEPADTPPAEEEEVVPNQDPGLSEEEMKNNAQLLIDSIATELEAQALEAYQNGEATISFPWPEGLLTVQEAEIFGDQLVSRSNFEKYEVVAKMKTITLYLGLVDDGEDAGE